MRRQGKEARAENSQSTVGASAPSNTALREAVEASVKLQSHYAKLRILWMHELSKAVEVGNELGLMGIRVKGIRFRADGAMQVDTEQVQCLSICEGEAR